MKNCIISETNPSSSYIGNTYTPTPSVNSDGMDIGSQDYYERKNSADNISPEPEKPEKEGRWRLEMLLLWTVGLIAVSLVLILVDYFSL